MVLIVAPILVGIRQLLHDRRRIGNTGIGRRGLHLLLIGMLRIGLARPTSDRRRRRRRCHKHGRARQPSDRITRRGRCAEARRADRTARRTDRDMTTTTLTGHELHTPIVTRTADGN